MHEIPKLYRSFTLRSRPSHLPSARNFKIETKQISLPGKGELLVKILIAALSPWQNQRLKDFKNYTTPFQIGDLIDCDTLGQVLAGQAGGFGPGDLVTGRLGWQEMAITTPELLSPVTKEFPETTWLTALSSPGLTAYCAMDLFGRPMPGQTLAVTSAAGAVGSYAIQLGKISGMRVIGIAGGSEKCSMVETKLGADGCIDHSKPDFAKKLSDLCPDGINLFFDTLGGPLADIVFDNLAKYARVLIVGRTISNNSKSPEKDPVNMRQLWAKEASIQCFSRYSYPDSWSFAQKQMMELCRNDAIFNSHQVIEGFEKTPIALRDMLKGKYQGKVLVRYAHTTSSIG